MNWFVVADRIHLEPSNASEQEKQDSPGWQSPSDEHSSRSYNKEKKKTNIIKIKDDLKDYKNQTKVQLQLKNCG